MLEQIWASCTNEPLPHALPYILNNAGSHKDDEKVVIGEPVLLLLKVIQHLVTPTVMSKGPNTYYWYNTVCLNAGIDVKTLPMVGIIVQKSHINGKDDIQYVTLISRLESRGARFVPIYTSELDFFSPLAENNCDANGKTNVDTVINLTGSKHVWGAASQDDKKVVSVLNQLDLPFKRATPLVVQSYEEWQSSDRGLHPTQVVLKVSLLEIDCPVKPILHAGRELAMGRSVQLADDRVNCPLKWPGLRIKHSKENKSAITIFSSPLDRGIVGTAVYPDVFDSAVLHQFKKKRYDIGGAPNSKEAMHDIPKTNNCVASPEIYGNMSQNVNQFDLLLTHTSFTAAPLVDISGMILVIIDASWQSKVIVQGGKNGVKMPSPTMLTCFDLVLKCFTHANGLCNEEEGALVFEKEVQSFILCMLLLTNVCSSQKFPCPKSALL